MPNPDQAENKTQNNTPPNPGASRPGGVASPAGKPQDHPKGGGEAMGEHSKDAPQTPSRG